MRAARREFSAKTRVAAFERAAGRCEGCTARLFVGRYHYDHVIPDAMGGEPTLENCKVLCVACHGEKTAERDVPALSKVKRVERYHIGARVSRNPMPGSRASKYKRKMDGTVEIRR